MRTYKKEAETFSSFNFKSKHYAGLINDRIVANIQPMYDNDMPTKLMFLDAKNANGNVWSPYNNPVMDIKTFEKYIEGFSNIMIFEFETAKEKFAWMVDNL